MWIDWPNCTSELLYRGSEDGFTSQMFHQKCDDQGSTLVIVKSKEGFVFGGFTSVSWIPNG
jgi:hypothetical protein